MNYSSKCKFMIILKLDFDFDSQAEISSEFGKKVG